MRNFIYRVLTGVFAVLILQFASAQTRTNVEILKHASAQETEKAKLLYERLQVLAKAKGWEMVMKGRNGKIAVLSGVDDLGLPLYTTTDNNIDAAATVGTNKLWPGGITGLNLNGSSNNVKDKQKGKKTEQKR